MGSGRLYQMDSRSSAHSSSIPRLGEQFSALFARKEWGAQWELVLLDRQWPQLAPSPLGHHTLPAFMRREVLWLYVEDSVWMQELQLQKITLLQAVCSHCRKLRISDIRGLVQPDAFEKRPATGASPLPAVRETSPVYSEKNRFIASIENTRCRQALERMWRAFGDGHRSKG